MENNQGNWENPPRLRTTEGTAVAMMVASSATRDVVSISEMRIGPRSDRNPTAESAELSEVLGAGLPRSLVAATVR